MNSRDLEQVKLYRRYLLERADRSRSRLMKNQIWRWVERVDTVQKQERNQRQKMNEELRRDAA